MASRVEEYEPWIRDYLRPRYPELVESIAKALRAFDVASESGRLEADQLGTILESARSHRSPVGENIAGLLGELAARFPDACDAVKQMSCDPKAHVRVNALVALSAVAPFQLHEHVLRTALKDRSTKVRKLAADKAMQFGLRQLLPDIEAAIEAERNSEVRNSLKWGHALLRDGYYLRAHGDGRVWITCRTPGGGASSMLVTAEELEKKGLNAIARTLGVELSAA